MFTYIIKNFKQNLFIMILIDFLIVISSIFISILFRFDFKIPLEVEALFNFQTVLIFAFIKIYTFRFFSLYQGMWRYTSVWDMFKIIKSNFLSTLLLMFLAYQFLGFSQISRSLLIIDFIICTGSICISRLGIRLFFSHVMKLLLTKNLDIKKKSILLVGAGDSGQTIIKETFQNSKIPFYISGIIDDDVYKIGKQIHGVPIIASVPEISELEINFDEIYICIPSASSEQMKVIINECKKTNKPFKTLPSLSELVNGKISLNQLREVSILDLLGREEISLNKKSINNFIAGKRVLVTGAGGSIGSELVRQCIKYNPSVLIMIDISELNLFEIDRELSREDSKILFKPILSDIREAKVINRVFKEFKPQVVFHAAAYKHVPMQECFPWEAVKTNIFGTKNLSEISVNNNVEKFVLVSTDKAVKPVNVMGATKRLAEIITLNSNIICDNTEFMAVRFGNVLGSSGSVIPIFQEQIKNGGPVTVTDPDMERFFMSIPEASQLILQAGALGKGGEVFVLDMGDPIKILNIAKELIRLSGFKPGLEIPIKITGKRPGEKKIEELSLPTENFDTTKHDKIFVLKDHNMTSAYLSKKIKCIEEFLSGELSNMAPKEIRKILSTILPEYKPNLDAKEPGFLRIKATA
jgi:FlaA1/EpsC-like NDP-sugar epimerase